MDVIAIIVIVIMAVLMNYCMIVGLDLRKFVSWLYGAIAFTCGVTSGLIVSGDLGQSIKLGTLFAVFLLVAGTITRPYLEKFGLPKRWTKGDPLSMFVTKLIRNLRKHE
ncbi:MAG: hypothetical protein AB1846_06405 [Chloroflexota bacterium]